MTRDVGGALSSACADARIVSAARRLDGVRAYFVFSQVMRVPGRAGLGMLGVIVALGVATGFMFGARTGLGVTGVVLAAYAWPQGAAVLLPAAIVASPRFTFANLGDEPIFWRLEHALVAGALLRMAHEGSLAHRMRALPGTGAWAAVLAVAGLSVLTGAMKSTLTGPTAAGLSIGQWAVLASVFVIAGAYARGPVAIYAWALPIAAAAAWGVAEVLYPLPSEWGVRYRSFERVWFNSQANHYGGLFAMAAGVGIAIAFMRRWTAFGVLLFLIATAGLWSTGSRTGRVAWLAAVGVALLLELRTARRMAIPAVVAGIPIAFAVWPRIASVGSAFHERLVAWQNALSTVPSHPLLGLGPGARYRAFYDSQYVMVLAEMGIFGSIAWLALIVALAAALVDGLNKKRETACVCCAGLVALAAAAAHSVATIGFTITMVAGPLCWIVGAGIGAANDREVAA